MSHISVLLAESLSALAINQDGIYIDGTFGRGGHSKAILAKLSSRGRLLCIDKDVLAIKAAQELANTDSRVSVYHSSFAQLSSIVDALGLVGNIDGVLLDLGVSSPQIDEASRGFSFMQDGPLDMRMDTTQGPTVAEWINTCELDLLQQVIKEYGEERFARRIATSIGIERAKAPITTTLQLATIVAYAVPFKEKDKHPATRTFLALRMFINRELEDLKLGLAGALKVLKHGGKLAVVTFHSLEDAMVKDFMRDAAAGFNTYPKDLPIVDAAIKRLVKVEKKVMPTQAEIALNRRSRSAKLRIATKL